MAVSTRASGDVEKRLAANSAIVLSFIVALEFVIMISPFAFVFYAALNPFLLALNRLDTTRWLTAFFLPLCFVDVHLHTGEILQSIDLHEGSGWGRVPTPIF